jgi:hypothetical protein
VNQHLKRAVVAIGWSTIRGSGLGAMSTPSKRHYYGGQTWDDHMAGEKALTLCGRTVPKAALPGAPRRGNPLDIKVSPLYPSELATAPSCQRCERSKYAAEHDNLDDNGRPIDGGA